MPHTSVLERSNFAAQSITPTRPTPPSPASARPLGSPSAGHALLEQSVDSALRQAAAGDIRALNALTRLLDQAYGKPTEQAAPDYGQEDDLPPMTREQRAKIMARLEAELAELEGTEAE